MRFTVCRTKCDGTVVVVAECATREEAERIAFKIDFSFIAEI